MDLLATVRKEGSRGGRGEFKWSEVQGSSHREHYLGHSVMAPVGRWQKGRDLNWYAKANADETDEEASERAARERREEIQRVKEAEQDAMAKALGLPVPQRNNANMEGVSDKRNFGKIIKEAAESGTTDAAEGQGVGFGRPSGADRTSTVVGDRIEGNAEAQDRELQYALREYKRRHGDHELHKGSRARSGDRGERHVRREKGRDHQHRRHRHSSRSRERHPRRRPRSRSRSKSRSRSRDRDNQEKRRDRSRSPYRHEERRHERRRRHD